MFSVHLHAFRIIPHNHFRFVCFFLSLLECWGGKFIEIWWVFCTYSAVISFIIFLRLCIARMMDLPYEWVAGIMTDVWICRHLTPPSTRYIHVDTHLLSIDCRENCERRHSGIQMTLLFIGNNFFCFISYLFTQFDVLCARSFYLCVILLQNVLEFSGFRFVHLAGFNSCDWLPFFCKYCSI